MTTNAGPKVDQAKAEAKAALLVDFVSPVVRYNGEWSGQFSCDSRTQVWVEYLVNTYGYPVEKWFMWACTCDWSQMHGARVGPRDEPGYYACAHVRAARGWYEREALKLRAGRGRGARPDWRSAALRNEREEQF